MGKKLGSLLLILVMLLGCATVAQADALFTPGAYTAAGKGMGGDVPVTVTFSADKIESVEVGENHETAGLGTVALEELPPKIVKTQSLAVDGVAGATVSSTALLEAVRNCVAQAGGDVEKLSQKAESAEAKPAEDVTVDVIIAGGGAAGLTAGCYAKQNGVENVVLLEALSFCGGSTALSGGVMTRSAMEGDPEGTMTADELYDYFYSISGGKVPDENLRQYVDNSPADWSWFYSLEGAGEPIRYHLVPENAYGTNPAAGGKGVADTLEKEATRLGVDIRRNHRATALLQDDKGAVIGLKCLNADGAEQNFYAKAVVLATGGFANSQGLLLRFAGTNAGEYVERKGAGGANGDGILMGEAVGAQLHFGDNWDTSGMNNIWITTASFYASQWSGIILNDEGVRFVREDDMLPRIFEEMVNQINAGHVGGFHVVETMEGFAAAGATEEQVAAAVEKGDIVKCDTLEALAEETGLPANALQKAIADYAAETEDPFGKKADYLGKLNPEGPFYTALTHPVRSGTMGGLVINTKSEVLDKDGNPIPGLLAAGETANGSFFDNYYYICGNMVMHAVVTGHAAGDSAAALAK